MRHIIVCLILLLAAGGVTNAQTPQMLIKEANQAYKDENYNKAITLYDSVINSGMHSAKLYYNLGNAYFKANDLAPAILYYERAKKLKPFNERISHNLEFAQQLQKDEIESLPVMFYVRWWQKLTNLFSLNSWSLLSLFLILTACLFWAFFIASNTITRRRRFFWISLFISVLFLLTLTITLRNYHNIKHEKAAIVFQSVITGKSSPDRDSKDLFVIHEGLKVHVLNKIGDWYEIKLPDGTVGWLPAESIKVI
ncbi:MAG: tetratricopeptide repeat protein [Bacteroidales bacterium]|nr:tetratricopeptide repeat protein [Bacteroidales bacterium]